MGDGMLGWRMRRRDVVCCALGMLHSLAEAGRSTEVVEHAVCIY
jgi:hypothetical protein